VLSSALSFARFEAFSNNSSAIGYYRADRNRGRFVHEISMDVVAHARDRRSPRHPPNCIGHGKFMLQVIVTVVFPSVKQIMHSHCVSCSVNITDSRQSRRFANLAFILLLFLSRRGYVSTPQTTLKTRLPSACFIHHLSKLIFFLFFYYHHNYVLIRESFIL